MWRQQRAQRGPLCLRTAGPGKGEVEQLGRLQAGQRAGVQQCLENLAAASEAGDTHTPAARSAAANVLSYTVVDGAAVPRGRGGGDRGEEASVRRVRIAAGNRAARSTYQSDTYDAIGTPFCRTCNKSGRPGPFGRRWAT